MAKTKGQECRGLKGSFSVHTFAKGNQPLRLTEKGAFPRTLLQRVANLPNVHKRVLKGQMVFEFIVAALIFFAIIVYILNYMSSSVFAYNNDYLEISKEAVVVQVSDLFVKDKGEWSMGIPVRVGLAKEWPVLDRVKINNLESYCNTNYNDLMDKIYFSGNRKYSTLEVKIKNEAGTYILDCSPPYAFNESARIKRFGIDSETNEFLEMNIRVR